MKFLSDTYQTSVRPDRTVSSPTRPSVMVNNFLSDSPDQVYRSKSVLFTRSSVEGFSLASTDLKQKDTDSDLIPSPRSDVSKISKLPQDELDDTENRKITRSMSVNSDMDDNVSIKTSWQVFANHIKNIDVATDYVTSVQKPNFKSSDIFQKVMVDLYGNPEYGQKIGYTQLRGKVGNISAMTSRMMARRRAKKDEALSQEEAELELLLHPPPSKRTLDNAKRGWVIIRRYVQEQITQKKCNDSNLKWTMLNQTLRAMSNTERTRMDLYQRYGLLPKLNKDGRFVRENSMLSERARVFLKQKESDTEMVNSQSKVKNRAKSSFLPRCLPNNSHGLRQSSLYSRQRATSLGHKPT
ncbi:hypothetical protein LOTGIDRAFT_157892 [Lottia gigantea]|uniref:Uncharacterized protein n=1 Tax=Lottia gigantea TaxID=225164 RepID=V4CF34_LOTGI|nr:hypothetical protein LOTGIDRAFT_157892 [Lottia gigantea]ESP00610.1 hypothetical protein LOTGIDRAFT_157892 [Lottia gigantea]